MTNEELEKFASEYPEAFEKMAEEVVLSKIAAKSFIDTINEELDKAAEGEETEEETEEEKKKREEKEKEEKKEEEKTSEDEAIDSVISAISDALDSVEDAKEEVEEAKEKAESVEEKTSEEVVKEARDIGKAIAEGFLGVEKEARFLPKATATKAWEGTKNYISALIHPNKYLGKFSPELRKKSIGKLVAKYGLTAASLGAGGVGISKAVKK